MVRTVTVVSVCLALIVSQVSAESSPSLLNRNLQARQGWTLPPDEIPAACQAGCTSVNTMVSTCTHVSCLCTNAVGSALQSCFTCVVNSGSQITKEAGQQQLTQYYQGCKTADSPVNPLTIGGSSSSSSSPSTGAKSNAVGLRSGMTMFTGALGPVAGILYFL